MLLKNAWYPLSTSEKLRSNEALAVELFGEPLVLFRDETGTPVCLQDRCPHRSAALSQGRVADGRIECRYHGWQFGGSGECLRVPSQKDEVRIPARASATKRPTLERRGLVWVWPGDSNLADEAAMLEAPFAPLHEPGMYSYIYEAVIPVSHELLIENLLDPAHIPFTHHGTMSRRDFAQPIRFEDVADPHSAIAAQSVFEPATGARVPLIERVVFKFYEPCVIALELFGAPRGDKRMRTYQVHYCVPLNRERAHMFSVYGASFLSPFKWLLKPIFRKMAEKALNQDFEVLKGQHDALSRGAPAFGQAVAADKLSLAYRKWLQQNLTDDVWFKGFAAEAAEQRALARPEQRHALNAAPVAQPRALPVLQDAEA